MPRKPPEQRWLATGVELEGGWTSDIHEIARKSTGSTVKHDGSVRIPNVNYVQEVTTRPHKTREQLLADVTLLHPEHANETCGYHLHTSFTLPDYMSLMDKAFWSYYLERWAVWFGENASNMTRDEAARFKDRFEGKRLPGTNSNFCKRDFQPAKQMRDTGDRYYQLNFAAWHKYKTLECRMLPMFTTKEVTLAATAHLMDIYDDYLGSYNPEGIFSEDVIEFQAPDAEGYVVMENVRSITKPSGWEDHAPPRALPKRITGPDVQYAWRAARVRTTDVWEGDELTEGL